MGTEPNEPTVYTVGHGAQPVERLLALLRVPGIRLLVDVRSFPGSRKHPQFGRETLAASLGAAGVEYAWRRELGGFRRPRPHSRHTALTSTSFRGYADHMETDAFLEARAWLIDEARARPTAIMCAESLWWRCHRSMIADALVAAGWSVEHLLPDGTLQRHAVRPQARIEDGVPVYDVDAGQARLLE